MSKISGLSFNEIKLINLSKDFIKNKLIPLTLMTKTSFLKKRLEKHIKKTNKNDIVILLYKKNKILGWGLIFDFEFREPKVVLFVDFNYRQKGLGKKIIEKAIKILKRKKCCEVYFAPWNNISFNFFTNFEKVKKKRANFNSLFTLRKVL